MREEKKMFIKLDQLSKLKILQAVSNVDSFIQAYTNTKFF